MIYPYALTYKTLPPELRAAFDDVVKMLNVIKSSAFNTRNFRLPCQHFGATTLLFYTDIRWLSPGTWCLDCSHWKRTSQRGLQVRKFVEKLTDNDWLLKNAYMNYIFSRLNLKQIAARPIHDGGWYPWQIGSVRHNARVVGRQHQWRKLCRVWTPKRGASGWRKRAWNGMRMGLSHWSYQDTGVPH